MDLYTLIRKNIIILLLVTISLINAQDITEHKDNNITNTKLNQSSITIKDIKIKQTKNEKTMDSNRDDFERTQNRESIRISNGKNDIPESYSVVQDWHLVCKQLCGAGLGGPACGQPDCDEIKTKASQKYNITEKAQILLDENLDPICQDLCKYQLGDEICSCHTRVILIDDNFINRSDEKPWGRNEICHTFCKHNDITITGCSLCSKEEEEIISTLNINHEELITPTTPNWEKICQELCKSGDGGSLCNCDKPPFF